MGWLNKCLPSVLRSGSLHLHVQLFVPDERPQDLRPTCVRTSYAIPGVCANELGSSVVEELNLWVIITVEYLLRAKLST